MSKDQWPIKGAEKDFCPRGRIHSFYDYSYWNMTIRNHPECCLCGYIDTSRVIEKLSTEEMNLLSILEKDNKFGLSVVKPEGGVYLEDRFSSGNLKKLEKAIERIKCYNLSEEALLEVFR